MQALNILCRIWKNKMIAPVLKTFMWKMLRNCLATGERAGSLSSKISRNCDYCGMTENDSHLFFHCNFSRAVWFSANPPLLTSNLPSEQDGVQEALTALITPNTQDNIMIMIITTLWFIWKARNELRFRQKKWSILQVHFAAQAHRRTNDLLSMQTGVNGKTQKNLGSTQNQLDLAGIEDRGVVCFTDAAIKPVARPEAPETAGVGILFKDNSQNTLITISAQIRNCSSVLMAETAGLSIASSIDAALQLNQVKFFTDNQTLADLLQRANLDGSPDWRIRPLAQNFFNNRDRVSATVHKIDRNLNYKAHALAKSAFSASNLMRGQPVLSCSNMNHVPTCPLKAVLTALCNDCSVTAAICC
jgi:ribonuclease HI